MVTTSYKFNFIIVIIFIAILPPLAVNDQTVTLTVTGQGQTIEEARQNALRSAIELKFGTFISSKTEIVNEDLVRDEIISVSSGNIQKYDILFEGEIPGIGYATTLTATVSVNKLTTFATNNGV